MSDNESVSSASAASTASSLASLGEGKVKDSSLKVYLSNGRSIAKAIGFTDIPDDMGKWIHERYDDIIAHIDKLESIHTQKNKIAALNFMATTYDIDAKTKLRLAQKMDGLFKKVAATYITNEMSEKQKKNWVTSEDIDKKITELEGKVLKPAQISTPKEYSAMALYLMLLFHKHLPVRNDLADTKVITDPKLATDENVNYIIINNKKKKSGILKMNKFKTRDSHGSKEIELPPNIVKELIKYLPAIEKMSPSRWLIPSARKGDTSKNITRNAYTKMFNKIWKKDGKAVSSTQLRRTAVTELHQPKSGEYQAKAALANIMCHTPATAALCYAKVFSADGVEQAD